MKKPTESTEMRKSTEFTEGSSLSANISDKQKLNLEIEESIEKLKKFNSIDEYSEFYYNLQKEIWNIIEITPENKFDAKKYIDKIIKKVIEKNLLSNLITELEKEDLLNVMNSGLDDFVNNIYLSFIEKKDNAFSSNNVNKDELVYGKKIDGKIIPYKDMGNIEEIDLEKLQKINNQNLRKYLIGFINLIKKGITDKTEWLKLEEESLKLIDMKESNIFFIPPIEKYEDGVSIYPDFTIGIFKEFEEEENLKKYAENIICEYYGVDIEHLKFDKFNFAKILMSGLTGVNNYTGRSMPDDTKLRKGYGNYSFLDKNVLEKKSIKKENIFLKIRGNLQDLASNIYGNSYEHSVNSKYKNTLLFYMYLIEKNKEKKFSNEKITKIIEVVFHEYNMFKVSLRLNLETKEKDKVGKTYFNNLLKSGLISLNEDNSENYKPNQENLIKFLDLQKEKLTEIKEIYNKTL